MATGQGYASRCALGVESTWGTGVAVSELIPFTSESINRVIAQLESEYLDGNAGRRSLTNSVVSPAGDLECELVWDEIATAIVGIERLLTGGLGTGTWDAVNSLTQFTLANTISRSYTLAFNKSVSVWESLGAKINTLKISGSAGEKVMLSAGIMAKNLLRTGDAGITNAAAALTSLAPANIPQNIVFDDCVFRLADQANAIAGGDAFAIDSFEVNVNNNFSEHQFSTTDATVTSALYSHEFLRNGRRETTLSITMPRYTADTIFTWLNSGTALQADLIFTSGSYIFTILLPNIKVTGDPTAPVSGPELIAPSFNFTCLLNPGTNTDMTLTDTTAITGELAIEVTSARTSAA